MVGKILVLLILLGVVATAVSLYGRNRWQAKTNQLQATLAAAQAPLRPKTYHPAALADLPQPVQRYCRTVLKDDAPMVAAAHIEHIGTFNMGQAEDNWKPFTSEQWVTTQPPGFVWDARISMGPGLVAHVHDAFVAGSGVLEARLLGLLTVMEMPNSPQLNQGELMRYLAETAWYPTALLPGQGVVWHPVDDTHARATLTSGTTTVTLTFQFNDQGLIKTVRSEGRYRQVNGEQVATPWQGQFWDYQWHDDMLVPRQGEAAWMLPQGPKLYWRGHTQQLEYEYAE